MRKFLKILILTFLGAVTITSCSDDSDGIPGWPWNDNSTEKPDEPDVAEAKPRYIWIDAAANFPDYANNKENIAKDMAKIKSIADIGRQNMKYICRGVSKRIFKKTLLNGLEKNNAD